MFPLLMRPPRWEKLLEKSEAALIASIEVFNKPDSDYREETFALLALNAWELLLKAKLVLEKSGDLRIIYSYERRPTKAGLGKKLYLKRNRSGNPLTIGMDRCINLLDSRFGVTLDSAVRSNLEALTEIRDNAAHFMNASPKLSRLVLELGTAALRNYVTLLKKWFNRDLSQYNLYLMPLGFVNSTVAAAVPTDALEKKLVTYLNDTIAAASAAASSSDYSVALNMNLTFTRAKGDAIAVQVTTDPDAVKIQIVDEDIQAKYPWDYAELVKRLEARYSDFVQNNRFHILRKPLLQDARYCKTRYLNPAKPAGLKKDFYNPNIISEFDKHYTLRP